MSEVYIVEKRLNVKAMIFVISSVLLVLAVTTFIFYQNIREHRLSDLRKRIKTRDFDNAEYLFKRLYEKEPLNKKILIEGVNLYYSKMLETESTDERIKCSEYVVSFARQILLLSLIPPKAHAYYNKLAIAYQMRGKGFYMDALKAYETAIKKGDNSIETKLRAGKIAYKLGRHKDAIRLFENASADAKEKEGIRISDEIRFLLANSYKGEKNFALAIRKYRELVSTLKDKNLLLNTYLNLAYSYMRQGLYNESEFFYKKSLEIDDKNSEIYYNIGILYKKMDRRHDAARYFMRARWLDGHKKALEELKKL